jgi:2-hydroxy-3-keto-5-methylthiopentenyl-1-phosphate phosphatase
MFYAGDGVSDLSAAKETDLLFAKKGHGKPPKLHGTKTPTDFVIDLITYCARENVPFTEFENWSSILATVKDIVAGKTTVKKVSAEGVENFKQAVNRN